MSVEKRLAYIISTFPKASETFVYREVLSLRAMGYKPLLFSCAEPSNADKATFNAQLKQLKQDTFYLSASQSIISLLLHPLFTVKILRKAYALNNKASNKANWLLLAARAVLLSAEIKKKKITLLHAHWPYSTMVAHLASKLTGIRLSLSIHAHEVAHENGHFSTVLPGIRFASFCNQAAMDYMANTLNDENTKSRFNLIYHGVNLDQFPFLSPNKSTDDVIEVISAGRLTKTKGFSRLVTACSVAKKKGLSIKLTILGTGPEKENILKTATEVGFTNDLTLAGWVAHDEVKAYMKRSSVFALLADTSYHDGLPNVVLEAMASGRGVILSPLPAAQEVVTNGIEGFILKSSEDYEGFANALVAFMKDEDTASNMGAAARYKVETTYADTIHIEKLSELLYSNGS